MTRSGFTLVEMMLGAAILAVAIVALMGSFFGQSYLSSMARNMGAAMNDATRIMEQIRRQNTRQNTDAISGTCSSAGIPNAFSPGSRVEADFNRVISWNTWLNQQPSPQGKSVNIPNRNLLELVAVTCQNGAPGAAANEYCGPNQVGAEWSHSLNATQYDPIRVTVAVAWAQQRRSVGGSEPNAEFVYTPAGGSCPCGGTCTPTGEGINYGTDQDGDGALESPAMLTTLISCR